MQLNLNGKKVAVFGAARGIGRAIAEAFVDEGCEVSGFDTAADDGSTADGFEIVRGDVADYQAVSEFARQHSHTDHVVFSVGVGSGKFGFPFWQELMPQDWSRVLEINLIGAVNVAHAFAPHLAERRCGTMLFLTSVAGQIGSQTDPPYSAAKAGLINFVQCAARDFAEFGVRANAIAPGMVRTGLNESVWAAGQERLPVAERQDYETWAQSKIGKVAPLGRWQEADELAAMAVFLASDHARNITGQTINIDGGQVMHA